VPHRTVKFVSAIVLSFIAGVPFATVSRAAAPSPEAASATDNCLASPKKDAPQGGHWYYRIEHPSNRHCWYRRDEQAASSNASASATAKSPPPDMASAMPGSVANARAELISPQTRSDPDANIVTGQVPAAAAGPVADADSLAPAQAQDSSMLRSVVASRWPAQLAANTPAANTPAAAPAPATDNSNAGEPANLVTPQPAAAAAAVVPLTAADVPPAKPSSSTQMLIIAIVGALSVAGLAASAVGFGGWRKGRARTIEGKRRAIWETTSDDGPRPSPLPAASRPPIDPSKEPIGLPKELRETRHPDPDDKIAEMLARLARSAQS
jgi:hypothetical protein